MAAMVSASAQDAPPAAAAPAATAFSLQSVVDEARALAAAPYASHLGGAGPFFSKLTYDQYRDIRFDKSHALWHDLGLPIEAEFFHPGWVSSKTVDLFEVVGGQAQPIPFRRDYFSYGPLVPKIPDGVELPDGYAGFRAHTNLNNPQYKDEFLVFQGASYFRAVAQGEVYGLSARGLALNSGLTIPEEFPDFEKFWLVRPDPGAKSLTVYALLNSPSVAGAYQFDITPGAETVMDVTATLFFRKDQPLIGIAPMSSMFWFDEDTHPRPDDWRRAVHDSDGLLVATRDGTWTWRQLEAGANIRFSYFSEPQLAGFGLIQRARNYEDYYDLEAQYDRRPDLWVEPVGDWGPGSVYLLELTPNHDFSDNVVACWLPANPPPIGQPWTWRYRLHWSDDSPEPAGLWQISSTRHGRSTYTDDEEFVIEFAKPISFDPLHGPPALTASAGDGATLLNQQVVANPKTGGWRVMLRAKFKPGSTWTVLTCQLSGGGRPVSERWDYLWTPQS
jgi:periplasmic glucans biosynthesis protein